MSGCTLQAFEPVNEQGLYARQFVEDLTGNHESWTHTISAVGGYDTASFTLKGVREYLDDWFDDGLFRRIVFYTPEAVMAWEGFVNRLRYNVAGTLQKTKSMEGLFNRVYCRFAPLDFSVFPPVAGPPKTIWVDDALSQQDWGVKATLVSGGERMEQTALTWTSNVLKERKDVQVGESAALPVSDASYIEVECLGYYHVLKWLPYTRLSTAYIQAHQVIKEVLSYFNGVNPGWLSQDFGLMDYNFRTAKQGYDDYPHCWDVISGVIRDGGAAGERWVGGVYQDRQFTYKAAEDFGGLYADEFELWRALGDPNQFIYDTALGCEVKPWDMLPDKVLHTVDVNVGGTRNLMYIEQVTYTEPYGLRLVGGDDERLEVFLAQRGLPGL